MSNSDITFGDMEKCRKKFHPSVMTFRIQALDAENFAEVMESKRDRVVDIVGGRSKITDVEPTLTPREYEVKNVEVDWRGRIIITEERIANMVQHSLTATIAKEVVDQHLNSKYDRAMEILE